MSPENTDGAKITLELRNLSREFRLLTPSKEPKPEMTAQNLDGTKPAFGLEVYTHEMRSEAA